MLVCSICCHTPFGFYLAVASCHAMSNLINQRQNKFYHDYTVVVAAGIRCWHWGRSIAARGERYWYMRLNTKTITLSCGKLTTGVSVKPWAGILMLRNSSSPETYFQAAFRVQTPWVIRKPRQQQRQIMNRLSKKSATFLTSHQTGPADRLRITVAG